MRSFDRATLQRLAGYLDTPGLSFCPRDRREQARERLVPTNTCYSCDQNHQIAFRNRRPLQHDNAGKKRAERTAHERKNRRLASGVFGIFLSSRRNYYRFEDREQSIWWFHRGESSVPQGLSAT